MLPYIAYMDPMGMGHLYHSCLAMSQASAPPPPIPLQAQPVG